MRHFVLFAAFCLLLCGCNKPAARPQWQYKTLTIFHDELKTMKAEDANRFSEMDIQKELKTYALGDEYSSDWEVCGCFLEPRKDPCLIILLKKRY